MKKCIVLLVLLCLFCGCAAPSDQESAAAEPQLPETTETIQSYTEIATEPPFVAREVELEAVNVYSFRKATEIPEVAILDHRTAAFLTTEYPDKDYSRSGTRIRVTDLHLDAEVSETLLEGTYSFLICCGAPGCLALEEESSDRIVVMNPQLNEVLSFQAVNSGGVLSRDLQKYFYIHGGRLWVQATATGEREPLEMEYKLDFHEILDYDPRENILLTSAYSGAYSYELSYCAVDLDTMEPLLLHGGATGAKLTQKGVLLENHVDAQRYSDVYYCDWSHTQLNALPAFLVTNLDYACWHVEGSDYTCRVTYEPTQKVDIVDFQLLRLGETITACSLQEALNGAKITRMYALPDGNLLAMETNRRGYRTYLICPELLTFTEIEVERAQGDGLVDPELTGTFSLENTWEIPENLEKVRQKADALEEEYGITILISGQCTQAASATGMPITTTDHASLPDEAGAIDRALRSLDEVLELYPEDFFRQFRDEAGEKGILVLLVENISAELDVIGVSYRLGQWYPIAVDITSGMVTSTYCHEIWHATEYRITDVSESALDLFAWADCNPVGFGYSGNMTPSYIEDTEYTYFLGDNEEGVYFVDPYAKINGMEDRARLMEYVMCTDLYAGEMLEYEPMRNKLQLMCDAIRKTFDTTKWEDVHWERFF